MNKFIIIILGAVAVLAAIIGFVFFSQKAAAPESGKISLPKTITTTMTITSPSFQNNTPIPKQFTCDGENVNPELRFGAVPEQAKSLSLVMDDPDAPKGTFTHWLIWNIAPNMQVIAENSAPGTEGKNGAAKTGYIGPCPPSGTHRYFFKLYALDALLVLPAGADKSLLEAAISAHLLEKAELVGLYKRQ